MKFQLRPALVLVALASAHAQPYATKPLDPDKFRQLEELLPTPNEQRTASGAPGRGYWQQRADHVIDVELDDATQSITGRETITYFNNSPDPLSYLWLQIDANYHAKDADNRAAAAYARNTSADPLVRYPYASLEAALLRETYDSALKISAVTDASGAPLPHTIVKTMMRIDLPRPLAPGARTSFQVAWSYVLNNIKVIRGRSGFEHFPKDDNYIYQVAQWFPRMAVYGDTTGWQHKQFLGTGEFTLVFGDYLVRLTVPEDHIVSSTGVLQNPAQALSATQRERLKQAETAKTPVFIVSPEEAKQNETRKAAGKKTWVFKAENVRDFAFASSRKFIWDAMGAAGHVTGDARQPVMAMSFYPKEAEPLWSQYSTHAIVHTLDVYSKHTFPYPYPVAQSVNGGLSGGMEYPMICYNGPRPEEDGTYSKRTKYGLITVIIHEVGHNYFPMIVNSDERQWTWMDEGLNTFCQYLAEQAWEKDYPSGRGEPRDIAAYMTSADQVPIMTNSESIARLGPNAYAKPATALNVLRETVLGRELFDHAFKTYAQRWAFKHPNPADFFRTMEDASGVDLDWFWRGWFYTNDHVDIALDAVSEYTLDTRDPAIEKPRTKKEKDDRPETIAQQRNANLPRRLDAYPELKDFYNGYDEAIVLPGDRKKFDDLVKELTKDKIRPELLKTDRHFYLVDLTNVGGLVSPVILKADYADGSSEEVRMPAEIWRVESGKVSKLMITTKALKSLQLDPHEETADADVENNFWPRRAIKKRFQLFKETRDPNPMKQFKEEAEKKAKAPKGGAKAAETDADQN